MPGEIVQGRVYLLAAREATCRRESVRNSERSSSDPFAMPSCSTRRNSHTQPKPRFCFIHHIFQSEESGERSAVRVILTGSIVFNV